MVPVVLASQCVHFSASFSSLDYHHASWGPLEFQDDFHLQLILRRYLNKYLFPSLASLDGHPESKGLAPDTTTVCYFPRTLADMPQMSQKRSLFAARVVQRSCKLLLVMCQMCCISLNDLLKTCFKRGLFYS